LKTAEQIALWADKLRDLSAEGLRYAQNSYDQERYRAVQDVALAMLALASDRDIESLEPLRGTIFTQFTPLIGGDAAVIDDDGRILLIQRSDNGLWAMPGGALQVGETPAEGVLREVLEETGIPCQAIALVGIFDIRPSGLTGLHHLYLITFLCRPIGGNVPAGDASHSHEVLDLCWFKENELPENLHFTSAARIRRAFSLWKQGEAPAFFDAP
jgi:8-oxo-dGTP pyrophosphatase MutT (NUDIX family)